MFLATHMSLSKIDHMFVSPDLILYLVSASSASHSVSDHSPGILEVVWDARPISTGWHLNLFWLTIFPQYLRCHPHYFTSNINTADPLIVCDALKAFICGYLTSTINTIKKATIKSVEELEAKALAVEGTYLLNPSDDTWASWLQAQMRVKEAHVEADHR